MLTAHPSTFLLSIYLSIDLLYCCCCCTQALVVPVPMAMGHEYCNCTGDTFSDLALLYCKCLLFVYLL